VVLCALKLVFNVLQAETKSYQTQPGINWLVNAYVVCFSTFPFLMLSSAQTQCLRHAQYHISESENHQLTTSKCSINLDLYFISKTIFFTSTDFSALNTSHSARAVGHYVGSPVLLFTHPRPPLLAPVCHMHAGSSAPMPLSTASAHCSPTLCVCL